MSALCGERVSSVIGNAVGSALTAAGGELVKGERSVQEIAKESAKAAASGLFSELGSQYIGHAADLAGKMDSVARKLIKNYTSTDGEFLTAFFDELLMALDQGMSGG